MKKINKVVIPIAGYGSRMFPSTIGVTKAMLPLVDRPVIEYLIEECVKAEIYEIIIVMSDSQESVKDYLEMTNKKLFEKFIDREEVKALRALLNKVKISYVVQTEQKGLGHAIYCAKDLVGDEDFGVLLGDNPILSREEGSFGIGQLKEAYLENPGYYIGVKEVSEEECKKYGIVDAEDTSFTSFRLTGMIEKPKGTPPTHFAALGRYILGASIFNYLEHITPGAGGEIQVTDAIRVAITKDIVYGTKLKGTCHDTGCRNGFVKANLDYALLRSDISEEMKNFIHVDLKDILK